MEDKKLQQLKNIAAPPPSLAAKRHAIHAAQQAFEAVSKKQFKKKIKKFQGLVRLVRLINSFNQILLNFIMKKQFAVGAAVTFLLAIILVRSVWLRDEFISPQEDNKITEQQTIPDYDIVVVDDGSSSSEKSTLAVAGYNPSEVKLSRAQIKAKVDSTNASQDYDAFEPREVLDNRKRIGALSGLADNQILNYAHYEGRDKFEDVVPNPLKLVSEEPVSTFSVDVDTASYAFVRKSLNSGRTLNKDSVRVEELINYFDYDYVLPKSAEEPFKPTVAVYPTPWNKHTKLLHIGIKGHDIIPAKKPKSNLVFLVDVSGSMNNPNKLPLLKNAFKLMVENLQPTDTVSIVTYAGSAGTVLEPTKVEEKSKILSALERLRSGGSTAGEKGIKQAYTFAEQNFDKTGVNRVILATDGDFNVGITSSEKLKDLIGDKRDSGYFSQCWALAKGTTTMQLCKLLHKTVMVMLLILIR